MCEVCIFTPHHWGRRDVRENNSYHIPRSTVMKMFYYTVHNLIYIESNKFLDLSKLLPTITTTEYRKHPNIKIRKVSTPVTIPIALLPKTSTAQNVARTVVNILTRLLPIKIVIRSLWGLLFSFTIALLANFLSLLMAFTLAGDREVNAISAPETNKLPPLLK